MGAPPATTIDMRMMAALARLTDNEKECLRRRLQQQTAKEMALELGVSPHAVEKRLKMARAKLGLSSSLEAARLLTTAEAYQRTGPQPPDLAAAPASPHDRLHRPLVWGVPTVILAAAALAVIAQISANGSDGGVTPIDAGGVAPVPPPALVVPADAKPAIVRDFAPQDMAEATPAEIQIIVRDSFAAMDKNRSGYIEPGEMPVGGGGNIVRDGHLESPVYTRDEDGNVKPTGEVRRVRVEQAQAEALALGDENGDGRVDFIEYRRWQAPIMAQRGIPREWKADINRPIEP
jgi:DNA-binding CsgD family transcriptional regulator